MPLPVPKARGNILLLGLVSLLNDISSEIIQPILPLFIASLGGGGLAVGLIGGVSDGLPSILKVFSGYWSDRLGKRKPLVVAGYSLSALGKLFLPFVGSWSQVFLLKVVERSGKGIRSAPRDAMICESADVENRGRGFGLHRAMDTMGAVAGSIIAFALWKGGMDYAAIFFIAGILAILALIPFFRVKESYQIHLEKQKLRLSDLSPELRRFMPIASLFALGNFSYMFFILKAQQQFAGEMATTAPLLLYVLFNLFYAAFAMPAGIWSDRIGRKRVLILGYALFAAIALGFALISTLAGLVLLFALYGLAFALVDGSERAFISDLSAPAVRSTSLGFYHGVVGIAAMISSLIAGALWSQIDLSAAFFFAAGVSALASLALMKIKIHVNIIN